jgi:nucleoid DNA-binding protein
MALYIGSTKLRQQVAEASGLSPEVVHRVLDAHDSLVKQLVEAGAHVRVVDLGYLVKMHRKATRVRLPKSGELIAVPARDVVKLIQPKPPMANKRPNDKEPVRGS